MQEQRIATRLVGIPLEEIPEMRRSILKRTVKDLVAEKLASLIATGVLSVGDELPGERELSAILSVSRETIRGAIQTLAARGIVEVSHGSRTRVARADVGPLRNGITSAGTINSYDLEAVHAARLLVERVVVADAAERITAETLRQLDASLVAQRAALDEPVRFLICDREFHVAIYRSAGNRLLADFVIDLYTYMMEFRRIAVSRVGAIRKSYEDHAEIVAALRAGDAAGVVIAFDRHINRIYTTTHSLLRKRENRPGESGARAHSEPNHDAPIWGGSTKTAGRRLAGGKT
jgi:DNA-binding FadR family transcriptional regulator